MIHEVSGDILLTKATAIAHGIAPHDHFDQGLAKALRERWPAMPKDFRHYCHERNPKTGEIWTWSGPGVRIINLMTQEPAPSETAHPGKASLSNVRHSLEALRKEIQKEKLASVAMPRLASGVGGLAWTDVRPLLQEYLGDLPAAVFVYATFHSGVQALEPGLNR